MGVDHSGLAAAFVAAPAGLLVVDPAGCVLEANDHAASLFGHDRAALVGRPVEELLPEGLRALHREHVHEYADAPVPRRMGAGLQVPGLRSDGTVFPVEVELAATSGADGPLLLATVRDVTEQRQVELASRRTEAAARRSEEYFRVLFEESPEGIVIVDERGRIARVNAQAEALFGWSRADLVGEPVERLVPMGDRRRHVSNRREFVHEPRRRPMGVHAPSARIAKQAFARSMVFRSTPI